MACALLAACAAPEDEGDVVGRSTLHVISLGEGEHVIEAYVAAGETENVSFETEDDTMAAVIQPEIVEQGAAVLSALNEPPGAGACTAVAGGTCSFIFPGSGSVVVGAQAGSTQGSLFRIRVSIRPVEGISTSP